MTSCRAASRFPTNLQRQVGVEPCLPGLLPASHSIAIPLNILLSFLILFSCSSRAHPISICYPRRQTSLKHAEPRRQFKAPTLAQTKTGQLRTPKMALRFFFCFSSLVASQPSAAAQVQSDVPICELWTGDASFALNPPAWSLPSGAERSDGVSRLLGLSWYSLNNFVKLALVSLLGYQTLRADPQSKKAPPRSRVSVNIYVATGQPCSFWPHVCRTSRSRCARSGLFDTEILKDRKKGGYLSR